MNKVKLEEKYPLLYLIVDEENSTSKNNRKLFERRGGITLGATTVLERWPGYLSTCWVSSIVSLLALVTLLLLLITALTTYGYHRPPRCLKGTNELLDSSTIHLVHGPNTWNQHELDMIEKIIQVFPKNKLHLIIVKKQSYEQIPNNMPTTETKMNDRKIVEEVPKRKLLMAAIDFITPKKVTADDVKTEDPVELSESMSWPFFNPRDFIRTLMRRNLNHMPCKTLTTVKPAKARDIGTLLLKYPDIIVQQVTFEEVFERTPLFHFWHFLNDDTKIFAIRVIQLWQYGGLSFDLNRMNNYTEVFSVTTENTLVPIKVSKTNGNASKSETEKYVSETTEAPNAYMDSLLYLGYSNFEMIPGGIVTLAENGCHMETRTACHSFFGELLMNLRYGNMYTTPEDVIKMALKYFVRPTYRSFKKT